MKKCRAISGCVEAFSSSWKTEYRQTSIPILTVNLTSIKRSPLLNGRGHHLDFSFEWLYCISPLLKGHLLRLQWNILTWWEAKHCQFLLTAHRTRQNTCNQRENAIAWVNRRLWAQRILVQFLPYYILYFRTPLLSSRSLSSGQMAIPRVWPLIIGVWL